MLDWPKISQDPNDQRSFRIWKDQYDKTITKMELFAKRRKDEKILSLIGAGSASSKVLDIGFAEHTLEYVDNPNWFHRKLRQFYAGAVYGVDINSELVAKIVAQTGWNNLLAADATDGSHLLDGGDFDVIHAGDIIEHLSNPGGFLTFCRNNLKAGGRVILTTPNPLAWRTLRRWAGFGCTVANLEHTCWITPTNMNELCRRFGFEFAESHYQVKSRKRSLLYWIFFPLVFRLRDFLFNDYIYIIRKLG
ncbi:MAG: class I SAM-dependent methyltransferase [Georgfuchsia sp.]